MASDPNGIPGDPADDRSWAVTRSLGSISSELSADGGVSVTVKLDAVMEDIAAKAAVTPGQVRLYVLALVEASKKK